MSIPLEQVRLEERFHLAKRMLLAGYKLQDIKAVIPGGNSTFEKFPPDWREQLRVLRGPGAGRGRKTGHKLVTDADYRRRFKRAFIRKHLYRTYSEFISFHDLDNAIRRGIITDVEKNELSRYYERKREARMRETAVDRLKIVLGLDPRYATYSQAIRIYNFQSCWKYLTPQEVKQVKDHFGVV